MVNKKSTICNGLLVQPFKGQALSLERMSPDSIIIFDLSPHTNVPYSLEQDDILVLPMYLEFTVETLNVRVPPGMVD